MFSISIGADLLAVASTSIVVALFVVLSVARSSDYIPISYYLIIVISIIFGFSQLVISAVAGLLAHVSIQYLSTIMPREYRWIKYREMIYLATLFILIYPASIYAESIALNIDPGRAFFLGSLIVFALYIMLLNVVRPLDLDQIAGTILDKISMRSLISFIEGTGKISIIGLVFYLIFVEGDLIFLAAILPIVFVLYRAISSRERSLDKYGFYTPIIKLALVMAVIASYIFIAY